VIDEPGAGLAVVRILIGLLFLAHGADILTAGMGRTKVFFKAFKVPAADLTTPLAGIVQTVGGLAMVVGLAADVAAWVLIALMVAAIYFVHGRFGFPNINITGEHEDGSYQLGLPGFEFNVALIAGLLAVAVGGGGKWSIT
jgi:putative oxidoreductase